MNAFPSHTFCPSEHRLHRGQLSSIPVLFEDAPTAFNGIVLAMVGRIVEQLNGYANLVCKFDHAVEKLSANPTTLWSIIDFELQAFGQSLLLEGQATPPILKGIDDEITGFMRTAKVEMQLSTIFIHNPTRNVRFLASHIVVKCLRIASGLPATRILANVHRGFAIQTQSFDATVFTFAIFGFDVVEDRIGFGQFFWGMALTTGFNR